MDHVAAGNPRKRIKISRTDAKASPSAVDNTNTPTMSLPTTTKGESSASAQQRGDHDETCTHKVDLKTIREDVNSISEILRCAICSRWMYEPYGLACGHTYCYSCLAQWLGGNQKKTCPDCRTVITQQPTPSYVLRELVMMFASRKQLLPDGETTEEHDGLAKDEAAIVAKDKADQDERTGGLFKGAFKRGRGRLMPMHDPGDNVDRCPRCHWEVADGMCGQCGLPVGDGASDFSVEELDSDAEVDHDFGDYDGDADDLDMRVLHGRDFDSDEDSMGMDDMDPAIIEAAFGGQNMYRDPAPAHAPVGGRRGRDGPRTIQISSDVGESDEDDDDDDEVDSELEAFIDDEAEESDNQHELQQDNSSDRGSDVDRPAQHNRRRGRAQVVVLDDDEGPGNVADEAIPIDDSDDDDAPVRGPASRQNKRNRVAARRGPVIISDDDDSEGDDEDEQAARPNQAAFGRARSVEYQGSDRAPSTTYDEDSEPDSEGSIQHDYHTYHNDHDDSHDDDDSDEDDEDDEANGYAMGTRPNPSASTRNDHRLETNTARRSRHTNAPLSLNSNRHSPSPSSLAGPSTITRRGGMFASAFPDHNPDHPSSSSSTHRPHPAARTTQNPSSHPFQLANTLADINSRRSQPAHPSSSSMRMAANRSASATSNYSSPGGVEVGSSQESGGSSRSSRTAGRPDSPRERRRRKEAVAATRGNAAGRSRGLFGREDYLY